MSVQAAIDYFLTFTVRIAAYVVRAPVAAPPRSALLLFRARLGCFARSLLSLVVTHLSKERVMSVNKFVLHFVYTHAMFTTMDADQNSTCSCELCKPHWFLGEDGDFEPLPETVVLKQTHAQKILAAGFNLTATLVAAD